MNAAMKSWRACCGLRGTRENQLATKRGADFGDAGRRAAFVSSQIVMRANSSSADG